MAFISRNFSVSINDINSQAVCTNKAILRFLEEIACYHSDIAGYGVNDILTKRYTWVLLGWKVKILSRPKYGENIKVVTWSRYSGAVSTFRDFEVYDEKGNLVVIATTKWALINIDKGLAKVTDDIYSCYSPEDKRVFDEDIKRLHEPNEFEKSFEYVVSRRDIDINHHVHNLNYLDFAYETLPEELFLKETNNVEISYKSEAKQNDTLTISYSNQNNEHTIVIKEKTSGSLCCIVKLY